MFSKAKRFEIPAQTKDHCTKHIKKNEISKQKPSKPLALQPKLKQQSVLNNKNADSHSQCSSLSSVKSFITPKLDNMKTPKVTSHIKKPSTNSVKSSTEKGKCIKTQNDIIKAQEVEIRNKDHTISEYIKQIEELKNETATLQKQIQDNEKHSKNIDVLNLKIAQISLTEIPENYTHDNVDYACITDMKNQILELELQCEKLELELHNKQLELSSLEEVISIRDSLCKDLQEKITNMENILEETHQRLDMVKRHHALALEANESIRREYKVELETLKSKLEDEKQMIMNKCKTDQENIKSKYHELIEAMKNQLIKEHNETVYDLQQEIATKDREMKAKLDQINETTHEKLRLCEIQFEERMSSIQEHCSQQQSKILYLEQETKDLKYSLGLAEEQNLLLQKEMKNLKNENEILLKEKHDAVKKIDDLKEESKQKLIDFENEINKLTVEIDKTVQEKNKFEMSLSVTRDIVQVLTIRLRESDSELEHLENKVQTMTNSNEMLSNELSSCKNTLNNTILECNEYKEALVNILKSKAALAKEHNRIMEHNVSLIESLQNVEKEAYRELGSIKNELIEDVEILKKESNSQIKLLREEVEKKRVLCELATEHAGQATAAAEQSRVLLAQAATEIARLEAENQRFQQQIQDQQSLVVELSLLRQENEELTMAVAKQSSIIDKMKKEMEQPTLKPKSPSVARKTQKIGKENIQTIISPLRERNH